MAPKTIEIPQLKKYGASKKLINILKNQGIKTLFPPQILSCRAGLLSTQESFVIASPTASGKTLIAEMAMLKTIFEDNGKIIYLLPLRALANEKYDDFTKKYQPLGIKIAVSTGDYDSADFWLERYQIIISTNEKMDSLIRHRSPWINEVTIVVADEIHLLGDPHRGPTLEIILSSLRTINPKLRILALSATIKNASEIANWLNAKIVESKWRPVVLKEGVFFEDQIFFNDNSIKKVKSETKIDSINLAINTIKEGGQALIFINTRRSTESLALQASKFINKILNQKEKEILEKASSEVLEAIPEPTRICRRLAEVLRKGVAFHHAGIHSKQRKIVEDLFRNNKLKLVISTTTLAMGLNLPSRRVIIRNWTRYESGKGIIPIPVFEVKQMSGRAGRPKYDKFGESVLISKSKKDREFIFKNYIMAEPEKIKSQLENESVLRTHILALICGNFTNNKKEIIDFVGKTFFAKQRNPNDILKIIERILIFLETEEMIEIKAKNFIPTTFGKRVSELYIDPLSAVIIREFLKEAEKRIDNKKLPTPFSYIHAICHTPDMMILYLKRKEIYELEKKISKIKDDLLFPVPDPWKDSEYFERCMAEIKTASVIMDWIEEVPEDKIVEKFGIGPGDIRNINELCDWLLYAVDSLGKILKLKKPSGLIPPLRKRIRYGVKEELLELVSLSGIGRIRARNLFEAKYRSLEDLKKASIEDLSKIHTIGKGIATNIKQQLLTKTL
ncbi:MAG: DEAD/DEAH box helicase [Acidobacteriota bacterium]